MTGRYIRADLQKDNYGCACCDKKINKNNSKQIVYFCSKECRKNYRHRKEYK